MKRILVVLMLLVFLMFTGCSDNKRIDKAEVVKFITAQTEKNENKYTFYLLTGEQKPVSVEALDLAEAKKLVKKDYLPELSLSRLEMIIYEEKFDENLMLDDVNHLKKSYSVSPLTKILLANKKTLGEIEEDEKKVDEYNEALIRYKKDNKDSDTELLSVYNKNYEDDKLSLVFPYITEKGQIVSKNIEIASKKLENKQKN